MKVYRVNKNGYIEELNTVGNYKPKGWYLTKELALKYKNKRI